ncbi:hypothetical protein F4820DRAFT_412359 [Hypoxylon rubiginosum]|uniref:Uncharacterized protein n=1 Tax=Hypoxylon rubiginosum TaxID=110542 RepID=A0ACB9Z8D1_9PEZI|nr:hypothetical protein F4820DRAFT_412359 [Hypoxylon rubiginosum]
MRKGAITANKIVIWRDEVNSSQKYCVCSRPSMKTTPLSSSTAVDSSDCPEAQPSESSSPLPFSYLPPAAQAGRYHPWRNSSSESSPSRSSNPFDDPAKTRSIVVNIQPRDEPFPCSNCGALIDLNVISARLGRREDEGSIRKRSSPMVETNCVYRVPHKSHPVVKWYRRFKRRANEMEAVGKFRKKIDAALEDEKSTGRRALQRPLSKLFKGKKKSSSSPEENRKNRPRATEMYGAFRSDASSEPGSAGIEWSLSDGEYRRPRLAVEGTAARLRRAQRLLKQGAER